MLKDRGFLEAYLERKFSNIVFEKDICKEIYDLAEQRYSIRMGLMSDYLTQRTPLKEANEFILFILCNCTNEILLKNGRRGIEDISIFYTEKEINFYRRSKYEEEKIEFPLKFKVVQIEDDQWIGRIDIRTLMILKNASLIYYNTDTQRVMQRVVKGNKEIFKISVKKKSVEEISREFSDGTFIPNTITLNIPDNVDADFYYDSETCELVFKNIDHFDITDGYHRFLGAANAFELHDDFNYNMELRITTFSEDKALRFINQEDKKNHMKKIDSKSMNTNDPSNMLVKRINEDSNFDLKGKISRNEGLISFSEFSELIRYFYFKGVDKKDERRIMLSAKSEIVNNFNKLTEYNVVYLEQRMSYEILLSAMFCFDYFKNKNIESSNICQIIEKTAEIINSSNKRNKFKRMKVGDALMKCVKEIVEGILYGKTL